jgi:hypothetical protein
MTIDLDRIEQLQRGKDIRNADDVSLIAELEQKVKLGEQKVLAYEQKIDAFDKMLSESVIIS